MGMMNMGTMMFPTASTTTTSASLYPTASTNPTTESLSSSTALYDSVPLIPRQRLSLSASLASTSSEIEAASTLTNSTSTPRFSSEVPSSKALGDDDDDESSPHIVKDDVLPNKYLVTMLKNYGQSFQVPSLTQDAKEYYGYE